jgi:5-methylcytosine-specific restriction endonuclease McrA
MTSASTAIEAQVLSWPAAQRLRFAERLVASVEDPIEHIVARQHGGSDDPANLALACPECNSHRLRWREMLTQFGLLE